MVNKVTLIGNVGGEPEIRHLENGTAVGKFSLATNENYKDKAGNWQTQTEWHNVVVWRNLAERAETSVKKGLMLYVEGKLSTRKWQDKDGNPRYTTDVVASYYRILTKRENAGGDNFPASNDAPANSGNSMPPNPVKATDTAASAPENDDLPF